MHHSYSTFALQELDELGEERKSLKQILGSSQRLKTLVKKEITADAEEYGDDRRSPIVSRDEARAIDVNELIPTEPLTIILSEKGWVRAAKGHDISAGRKHADIYAYNVYGSGIGREYCVPHRN